MSYAFCFLIGVLIGSGIFGHILITIYWLILGLILIGILLKFKFKKSLFLYLSLSFAVGLIWTLFYVNKFLAPAVDEVWLNHHLNISAIVTDVTIVNANKTRLVVQSQSPLQAKLRLNWYHYNQQIPAIKPGQLWQLRVKLKRNHSLYNEFGFDYETYLYINGFSATGYIVKHDDNKFISNTNQYLLKQSRGALSKSILPLIDKFDNKGVIYALITGSRELISGDKWEQFIRTNTSHLTVVSGLHIGLVSGFVFLLISFLYPFCIRCVLIVPTPIASSIAAMIVALFYALLAGFSIATQRALLMVGLVLLGVYYRKRFSYKNLYSLAIFFVLIINPLSVLSAGFWLSFFAVAVILYSLALTRHYSSKIKRFLFIQAAISISMAPLILWLFQGVSILSISANLVAVPLVSMLSLPLSLLAGFSAILGIDSLSYALFYLADMSLAVLDYYLRWLSNISWGYYHWHIGKLDFVFLLLAMFLIFLPRALQLNWLGGLIVMMVLFFEPTQSLKSGQFKLNVFDIGQGLASAVVTKNHTMLFDAGFADDNFDAAKIVLVPFLNQNRHKQLTKVIISHSDLDHRGGISSVVDNNGIKTVLTSATKILVDQFPSLTIKPCFSGDSWQYDGVSFTFLNPPKSRYKNVNNNSCVLKIDNGKTSVLLTGDIEKEAEEYLLKYHFNSLKSSVMLVPHHGSNSSSGADFIAAINPDIAINSSGFRNRFFHPNLVVKKRYLNQNIAFYDTQCSGQISLLFTSTVTIKATRVNDKRSWIHKC